MSERRSELTEDGRPKHRYVHTHMGGLRHTRARARIHTHTRARAHAHTHTRAPLQLVPRTFKVSISDIFPPSKSVGIVDQGVCVEFLVFGPNSTAVGITSGAQGQSFLKVREDLDERSLVARLGERLLQHRLPLQVDGLRVVHEHLGWVWRGLRGVGASEGLEKEREREMREREREVLFPVPTIPWLFLISFLTFFMDIPAEPEVDLHCERRKRGECGTTRT